tara:strand:+ start:44 stop:202 length:159 start_codon:yes stop_codon:yes gene_type:complete
MKIKKYPTNAEMKKQIELLRKKRRKQKSGSVTNQATWGSTGDVGGGPGGGIG